MSQVCALHPLRSSPSPLRRWGPYRLCGRLVPLCFVFRPDLAVCPATVRNRHRKGFGHPGSRPRIRIQMGASTHNTLALHGPRAGWAASSRGLLGTHTRASPSSLGSESAFGSRSPADWSARLNLESVTGQLHGAASAPCGKALVPSQTRLQSQILAR